MNINLRLMCCMFFLFSFVETYGQDVLDTGEEMAFRAAYEDNANAVLVCITEVGRDDEKSILTRNVTITCVMKGGAKIGDKIMLTVHLDTPLTKIKDEDRQQLVGSLIVVFFHENSKIVEIQPGDAWSYDRFKNILKITGSLSNDKN